MSEALTTARVIGRFRKELLSEGVPAEIADDLVRDAARAIFNVDGVEVLP